MALLLKTRDCGMTVGVISFNSAISACEKAMQWASYMVRNLQLQSSVQANSLTFMFTSMMDSQKCDMVMLIMGLVSMMLNLVVGSHSWRIFMTCKEGLKDLEDMKGRVASVEGMQARFANFDHLVTCRSVLKDFQDMHGRIDDFESYDAYVREL